MNAPRHLPWKLERQLRDLAAEYGRSVLLRAWTRFGAVTTGCVLVLGFAIHLLADTPVPLALPVLVALAAVVWAWWRLVRATTRALPTREQIALYIDEQHPELENLAISSVAFADRPADASGWLVDRFFEQARQQATPARIRDLANPGGLRRQSLLVAAAWALALVASVDLATRLDWPWVGAQLFVRSAPPHPALDVSPGDIRVRSGEDQVVWFSTDATSETIAIRWQTAGAGWTFSALQPSRGGQVYYHTFTDIRSPITYQVQAGGDRSREYRIDVWSPAEVAWIDAHYAYPEYTGLTDRGETAVESIEGPIGTRVALTVHATRPVDAGQLTFAFGQPLALGRDGPNALAGTFEIGADDTFRVSLRGTDGDTHLDARTYPIVSRWDDVPAITIAYPRGDDEATALEEIPFAFSIDDDFGIWRYGIRYEIAGREPVTRTLGTLDASRRSVEATDLLRLESLDLSPGDFLTWYVWADDGHPDRDAYEQLSDPYFLEIRPYRRTFAEAVSNAGGQPGGGGGSAADQKQIIIATWNLRKAADGLVEGEFDERRDAIVNAQRAVLAGALETLGLQPGAFRTIQQIRESVDAVIDALDGTDIETAGPGLTEALKHEQMVHRLLLSLAPDEMTVAQGREGRGGGGARSGRNRELDALELTRRRDFAEEATTQNERLGQTEEVRKGIEDLAKRQTFINRDVSEMISEGDRERERTAEEERRLQRLIDEQRRNLSALERLAGDVASGDLEREQGRQAREGLGEAGRRMRETLRNLERDRIQQARASGAGALRELADTEAGLGSFSREEAAERLAGLAETVDALAKRQREIVGAIDTSRAETAGPRSLESETESSDVLDRKADLAEAFESFMNEAGDLAEKAEATQGLAARALNDWLRETSREGIYEDIERGGDLVRDGLWQAAERHERGILEKLEQARDGLADVAESLVANDREGMRRALDRLESLAPAGTDPLADSGTLDDFLNGDYREWSDEIRSTESLLREGSDIRRRLGGVREDIDGIRRRYRRDGTRPRFDLVYDQVVKPLQLAAEDLRDQLAREAGEFTVGIERLEAVPERYRKQVADYFRSLSESEKE